MKTRPLLIALALLGALIVGMILGQYVAAAAYFISLKTWPPALQIDTFWSLWEQLSDIPAQQKRLKGSALAALVIVYVLPGLALAYALREKRSLHGDARFAHGGEVRKAGLDADKGIIVGKYHGRYLSFGGQQFAIVAAPTRSGKGVGVVIPNCLNWPDSLVVLDIKLENFEKTSGFRAKNGQAVFLFNPFAADFRSHRWNPLSAISRDPHFRVGDVQQIAEAFYPVGADPKDAFWQDQAQNLFIGLVLYLLETPSLPCTLGEVLRQASGCGQPLDKHLKAIVQARAEGPDAITPHCRDALNRYLSTSENTQSSIKATFDAPLTIFANPIVDAATSANDFDLRDLRRRRMTVYIGIQPNRLVSAARLLNLFFSQLINLNTESLPERDPALKYQCLLLLDEFTALGRVGIIAKSVAYIAGYNLRLLPIVQSIAQLEAVYGKEETRNFISNHELQIVFPPREQKDAAEVSEMLGYFTEKSVSKGESHSGGSFLRMAGSGGGGGMSRSENTSDQRRALLMPQELREMPQEQQILFKTHCKPILCEKIRYYDDPSFTKRLLPPCEIAPIDMDTHRARAENRVRPLGPDEAIDISKLAINVEALPGFTGDPDNPAPEEVSAVVDAFFSQLGWAAPADESAGEAGETPPVAAGGAIAPAPAASSKVIPGGIDLALLDG